MHDHLGDQAVIGRRVPPAGIGQRVDAHAGAEGRLPLAQRADRGAGLALGVHPLGVHARLDGVARGLRQARLRQPQIGQRAARGDLQLQPHEVEAENLLGHRVFDLDTGVGLDEEHLGGVGKGQELEGAETAVVPRPRQLQRVGEQRLPRGRGEVRRRRDLEHLLVAALQGAVALEQVEAFAGSVAQHLHLDVAGGGEKALGVDGAVAEGGLGLGRAAGVGLGDLLARMDHAHPPAAAAGDGLDHQGRALGELVEDRLGPRGVHRAGRAGDGGHVVARRMGPRLDLVAEQRQRGRRRPHPGQARMFAGAREGDGFGQEPVARMHRAGAGAFGGLDQRVRVEIGARAAAGDGLRVIAGAHVQGLRVVLGEDGDGFDAHLGGGAGDADGDLATVRNQQAADRHSEVSLGHFLASVQRATASSTASGAAGGRAGV